MPHAQQRGSKAIGSLENTAKSSLMIKIDIFTLMDKINILMGFLFSDEKYAHRSVHRKNALF